jgi:chromosome partitioning protein
MAYIITIAQQKGGAGKTSLAAHLAATWSVDKGRRVALFDLDPQKSLTHWFQTRCEKMGDENTMIMCPSQGWRVSAELTRAKRDADVIVIDSPGKDDLGTRTAVRAADIVVMPVQPSPIDVWASKPTLELIAKEGTPALIVLNRLPSRAKLTDHLIVDLKRGSVPIARSALGNRISFAASFVEGKGITETEPHSVAAAEIKLLADEIWRKIVPGGRKAAA